MLITRLDTLLRLLLGSVFSVILVLLWTVWKKSGVELSGEPLSEGDPIMRSLLKVLYFRGAEGLSAFVIMPQE